MLGIAVGQLASARRSVQVGSVTLPLVAWLKYRSLQRFHSEGYTNWTITHAFYADMGGFVLETVNWPAFPLDAEQFLYLVTKRYIEYPSVDKADIDDKNKADGIARLVNTGIAGCQSLADLLVRLITILQALWFTVNCIWRPIQGLSLTTLELTTVSFILFMLATSLSWMHKPLDVSRPTILRSETPIAQILMEASDLPS